MVMEKPITIKFELRENDLHLIDQKIMELDLFNKTPVINTPQSMSTCSNYYLKVQTNSSPKELSWSSCRGMVRDEFIQFTNYMLEIIQSTPEYKQLPPAKGGYI